MKVAVIEKINGKWRIAKENLTIEQARAYINKAKNLTRVPAMGSAVHMAVKNGAELTRLGLMPE